MKRLIRWLVLIGVLSFSYFAWTKVEGRRSSDLRDELDTAIATNEQLQAQVAAFTGEKQRLHQTLSLAFPDRETQIGEILGLIEPEPEPEADESASEE